MKWIVKILSYPFKLVAISLIFLYKLCISPFFSNACRYTPTCSTYAIKAIKEFGVFKGCCLALKRILRCNPKSKGGVDPVPPNIKGDFKWLI